VRALTRLLADVWHAPRALLVVLVRGYRLLLSPWLGQDCRFTPTCSVYAITALQQHGAIIGAGLAGWRILRCNPLCNGGCDPVPDNMPWERRKPSPSTPSAPGLFTGLLQRETGSAPAAATSATGATDKTNTSNTSS
jgi:putative membrane protein insertion efficiency factor